LKLAGGALKGSERIIMNANKCPLLSVIVPLFNEEQVIVEMYSRISTVLDNSSVDFEVVLVNDGSRDRTEELAKAICRDDPRVKLITFSRNFGHQIAVTAGLDRAAGQAVVIIDADLQDPPEVIIDMLKKWRKGSHVVYGVRVKRKGESLFKRMTAAAYYRLIRRLTKVDIPVDTGDFRLMDRRVVDQLHTMREHNRFVRGMVSWIGFQQDKVEYVREERFAGETKYPFIKMLRFAIDGILSFSEVPLKISSVFGLLCALLSFGLILYGLIVKLLYPEYAIAGWASVFTAVLFLGGVQLVCVGILGEYLGRVYDEIKRRPLYVVREEVNFLTQNDYEKKYLEK
jgi:glycosyltransferase involved in cell wall biosynthesis